MKIRNRFIASAILSSLAVFTVAGPAFAAGTAFTCDAVTYQVVGNQLKIGTVDTSVSPAVLAYSNVGAPYTTNYNAAGYNTVDNFVYAISSRPNHLLKVASDGSVDDLGAPTGLPADFFSAGDMLISGDALIVADSVNGEIWSVNIAGVSAEKIGQLPSSPVIELGDFAIVSSAGESSAFGFDRSSGALVSFDPTANPIVVTVNTTVAVGPGISKGAVWTDSSGSLTTFVNNTGEVYSVPNPTDVSPIASKIATGQSSSSNDGMKCALSASAFATAPEATPTPAELPVTGSSFSDVLGLTVGALALLGAGTMMFRFRRRS